jgi:protein tyrosine phosphatase
MVSFKEMIDLFVEWAVQRPGSEKAVVHCSAGIGRTGTTLCLMHNIIQLWALRNASQPLQCSVFSTVRQMREQKPGMVQTSEQYQFIHRFLGLYAKQHFAQ